METKTLFSCFTMLILFSYSSWASFSKKPTGNELNTPIYLGGSESLLLENELNRQKFTQETFDVIFKCNRYKRNPNAGSRSLNCLAIAVKPEVNVSTK